MLTKLDVLSSFETIPVCTGYRLRDGSITADFPPHQSDFHHATGVFEELPGWGADISRVTSYGDLPAAARDYVRWVEERLELPVTLVGVGPRRDQILVARQRGRRVIVLVVGSGGREHALAAALARSPSVTELHAAPGNPGIAALAACHPVHVLDVEGIAALARSLDGRPRRRRSRGAAGRRASPTRCATPASRSSAPAPPPRGSRARRRSRRT